MNIFKRKPLTLDQQAKRQHEAEVKRRLDVMRQNKRERKLQEQEKRKAQAHESELARYERIHEKLEREAMLEQSRTKIAKERATRAKLSGGGDMYSGVKMVARMLGGNKNIMGDNKPHAKRVIAVESKDDTPSAFKGL